EGGRDIIVILVIPSPDRTRELAVEGVLPFEVDVLVAILVKSIGVQPETVIADISVYVKVVLMVELMSDGKVHIVEGAAVILILVGQQVHDPVGIGGTRTQDKGRLVLDDRSFQLQTAVQQAPPRYARIFPLVPFPAGDIEHGGKPAAVFGRYTALVKVHI